jgi:hypothetical protein
MRKPWDRPQHGLIPNRQGDSASAPIYAALGRAVSAWEGVAAALGSIFFATLDQTARDKPYDLPEEAFGNIKNVNRRVDQLLSAWQTFNVPYLNAPETSAIVAQLDRDLRQALTAVRGWAARRNDLAHGYMTRACAPDYTKEEQPLTTQYALCPSHARVGKWSRGEPEYNYLARDISAFAKAFRALDNDLERLAAGIEKLRLE